VRRCGEVSLGLVFDLFLGVVVSREIIGVWLFGAGVFVDEVTGGAPVRLEAEGSSGKA